jgi:hypothetical protein
MSLQVKPNILRGELLLDPLYYTSAAFVDPLRKDIEQLLQTFKAQYTSALPPRRAFSLFKEIWRSSGWRLLHLSVLEDLDRDSFTLTVFRLFLGSHKLLSFFTSTERFDRAYRRERTSHHSCRRSLQSLHRLLFSARQVFAYSGSNSYPNG